MKHLSSSIHAIHRPLARSQRLNIPQSSKSTNTRNQFAEEIADELSPEEDIENDFEETPRPADDVPSHVRRMSNSVVHADSPFDAMKERANSMATVRIHRRARLAEKLKEVFDLEDIKEVTAGGSILGPLLLCC